MQFRIGNPKSIVAVALLLLILPVSQSVYANSQPLSVSVFGATLDAGNQRYTVAGGQLAFASIAGLVIDPSSAQLQYSLKAQVKDFSAKGDATFTLQGTATDGTSVGVQGRVRISDMVVAALIPLGCTSTCNSALPFFFLGASEVQVTIGDATVQLTPTMQLESPYFNPWGAPIILASDDSSIVIVATYTQGTIQWTDVKVGGVMTGTLGGEPVSGNFNMTSSEDEDLVTGTAVDRGSISFTSMNPSFLDSRGKYQGTSVIPTDGATDCSDLTGIPGTCTQTGFLSTGQFSMQGKHISLDDGIYATQWSIPALGFAASVSATVIQK